MARDRPGGGDPARHLDLPRSPSPTASSGSATRQPTAPLGRHGGSPGHAQLLDRYRPSLRRKLFQLRATNLSVLNFKVVNEGTYVTVSVPTLQDLITSAAARARVKKLGAVPGVISVRPRSAQILRGTDRKSHRMHGTAAPCHSETSMSSGLPGARTSSGRACVASPMTDKRVVIRLSLLGKAGVGAADVQTTVCRRFGGTGGK